MAEKETIKAEYSMGLMDYQRFNSILERKAEIEFAFFMGKKSAVPEFFAILKVFYKEMRAAIVPAPRKQLDEKFKLVEILKDEIKVRALLEEINDELMDRRQVMGIGIPVFLKKSDSAQMHAGFKR